MPTTTDTAIERHLTTVQLARAEALREARLVLAARGAFASMGAVNAIDLTNVASWILDGRDPWATPATLTAAATEEEVPS